jgi:hypothetical protein
VKIAPNIMIAMGSGGRKREKISIENRMIATMSNG